MHLAHASAIATTRVPYLTAFDADFATQEASGGIDHVWEYQGMTTWRACNDDPLQSALDKTHRTPGDEPSLVK